VTATPLLDTKDDVKFPMTRFPEALPLVPETFHDQDKVDNSNESCVDECGRSSRFQ
jgi:hypothetical protein